MTILLTAILSILQAVLFLSESTVSHPIGQIWWVFLPVVYLVLGVQVIARSDAPRAIQTATVIAAGIIPIIIIWCFHDTMTTYLIGTWLLIIFILWIYSYPLAQTGKKLFLLMSCLTALSLLALPLSINRVSIKLPSLSADSRLEILTEPNSNPIRSGRYYQRIDSPGELKTYLATQIYFQQPHHAPVLRLSIERERIVVVIQDIVYEYAVGFLKLSLNKIQGSDLAQVKVAAGSDDVRLQTPPGEGLILDKFVVGDAVLLELPHIEGHHVSLLDGAIVRFVRLLFWVMTIFTIWHWRPRRKRQEAA